MEEKHLMTPLTGQVCLSFWLWQEASASLSSSVYLLVLFLHKFSSILFFHLSSFLPQQTSFHLLSQETTHSSSLIITIVYRYQSLYTLLLFRHLVPTFLHLTSLSDYQSFQVTRSFPSRWHHARQRLSRGSPRCQTLRCKLIARASHWASPSP